MTIEEILGNIWDQFLSFVGFVLLVGFAISLLNRLFYRLVGNSRSIIYVTGFIGTPIHELSHALMCILFGHTITDIQFFRLDGQDGTLGYVAHSSDPRNPYQQMGNYFIGVAPIFVGSMILYLLMRLLLPETHHVINVVFEQLSAQSAGIFDWFYDLGMAVVTVGKSLFVEFVGSVQGWIFFFISMCIALHMNLSLVDVIGTLLSLPIIAVLLVVLNFVLGMFVGGEIYSGFVGVMDGVGLFVALMLSFSLLLSVVSVVLALVYRALVAIFRG